MPSIIAIVGTSNTGKTTLVEKLVGELKSRGYRVATIKHAPHGTTFDESGTDSWRHIQAGSEATIVSSPEQMLMVRPVTPDITLEELVGFHGEDYDIIIAEGFKRSRVPKIEVHRREAGPPLTDIENIIAIATDEPLETGIRQFSLEDVTGLVSLIEEDFIHTDEDRLSLYINDKAVPLKEFPRGIITNIVMAIASSLSGVGQLKSLKLFLRKKD